VALLDTGPLYLAVHYLRRYLSREQRLAAHGELIAVAILDMAEAAQLEGQAKQLAQA
jgi:hypothetical protein